MSEPFYDPTKSYEDNYADGPFGEFAEVLAEDATPVKPSKLSQHAVTLFGHKVNQPFGIPAGPLLNSKYVIAALDKGFDLPIYKTVRSGVHGSHPYPNVVPIAIEGVRELKDVSMWEQVALATYLQEYWADNQVSCTVTFKPEEAKDIEHVLNYNQYKIKGISFLPKTEQGAYAQMPYESITKEVFEELNKNVKPIDFTNISQDAIIEKYCDGDSCTI